MLQGDVLPRSGSFIALAAMAVCVALSLSACGRSTGSASVASDESVGTVPAYNTTRMSIATAKPVDAYVLLGGKIKTCWFNPNDPLFPEHVYRADVQPDGGKVKITIHDRRNLGRAGKSAYAIDFVQEGARTVVTTQNRTMTPEQAAKMQFDIDRWKAGQTNCSKEMPKVIAQPAAQ
jgi:hypothetical protein